MKRGTRYDRHRGIVSGFQYLLCLNGCVWPPQTASTDDVEVQTSPGAPGLLALGLAVEAVELALWCRLSSGYVGFLCKAPAPGGSILRTPASWPTRAHVRRPCSRPRICRHWSQATSFDGRQLTRYSTQKLLVWCCRPPSRMAFSWPSTTIH